MLLQQSKSLEPVLRLYPNGIIIANPDLRVCNRRKTENKRKSALVSGKSCLNLTGKEDERIIVY